MTREHKLALIVGFSLVLVVGVLISDHFSKARTARVDSRLAASSPQLAPTPTVGLQTQMPPARPETPHQDAFTPVLAGRSSAAEQASAPMPVEIAMGERPTLGSDLGSAIERARSLESSPDNRGGIDFRRFPAAVSIDPISNGELGGNGVNSGTRSVTTAVPTTSTLPLTKGRLLRHEVIRGDSLSKIVGRYYGDRTLIRPLQEYNRGRIGADQTVRLGTTILIPPKDVLLGLAVLPEDYKPDLRPAPDRPAAPLPSAKPTPAPAGPVYVVQSGDSLIRIAESRLGSSSRWREIRELNNDIIKDDDTLQVGMKLRLPAR